MEVKFKLILSNRTIRWLYFLIISIILVVLSHLIKDLPNKIFNISINNYILTMYFLLGFGLSKFIKYITIDIISFKEVKKKIGNIYISQNEENNDIGE